MKMKLELWSFIKEMMSQQNTNISIRSLLSNLITAYEVKMMADYRMRMVVSSSLQKRYCVLSFDFTEEKR